MINLFDTYNQSSWDLHYSLIKSGYENPTIVLNDDGFLPNDVTSPYLYFNKFDELEGRGLYFNEVVIPRFWEIRGNNSNGEIFEYNKKRGHIHYTTPSHLRIVKEVDWYDEAGRIRSKDHYNKVGYRFAQTIYNLKAEPITTSYYDKDNKELLVENHVTGDVTLNYLNKVHIFKSKVEFIMFYLFAAGYNLDRIFYNSLATPFFVAHQLPTSGSDILFWQESIGEDIPGNMKILLESTSARLTTIAVQDRATYDKMMHIIPPRKQPMVTFLGYIYHFKRPNQLRSEALIFTNSDQIEQLDSLVKALPQLHFNIAAITEMSSKLMDYAKYPNVSLYPNVTQAQISSLLETSDYYLDINHGNEILTASRSAFEQQMLILSFTNTLHNKQYIAPNHCFTPENVQGMINALAIALRNNSKVAEMIEYQKVAAGNEDVVRYKSVIG